MEKSQTLTSSRFVNPLENIQYRLLIRKSKQSKVAFINFQKVGSSSRITVIFAVPFSLALYIQPFPHQLNLCLFFSIFREKFCFPQYVFYTTQLHYDSSLQFISNLLTILHYFIHFFPHYFLLYVNLNLVAFWGTADVNILNLKGFLNFPKCFLYLKKESVHRKTQIIANTHDSFSTYNKCLVYHVASDFFLQIKHHR